jgi:hypothetical protein
MRQAPDLVINTDSGAHIYSTRNFVNAHNRGADAHYEAAQDMVVYPSGRAAIWWNSERLPYTTDVAATGLTETDLNAFLDHVNTIYGKGAEKVFDPYETTLCVILAGLPLLMNCCSFEETFKMCRWGVAGTASVIQRYAESFNADLRNKGLRCVIRVMHVETVGIKFELHHLA